MVAALAVSLAIPASRELHVLTARLLFRIETKDTYVQGQPSGCTVQVVPNVQFSEEFKKRCRKEASRYPRAFILASSLGLQKTTDYPPLESWSNHPWLDRVALELPYPVLVADYARRWRSNDTVVDVDIAALSEALDRCRLAQSESPGNGALWLAEAHVLLLGGFADQGLHALRTAVSKGNWSARTGFAYEYKKQLFESEGLSVLDAAMEAWESTPMPSYHYSLMHYLYDIMATAVIARDDEQFSSIVSLVHSLQDQTWQDADLLSGFPFCPFGSDDLIEAMADRLDWGDLPDCKEAREERFEAQEKIFEAFLASYLDADVAKEMLVRAHPRGDGSIQIRDPAFYRWVRCLGYSSVGGMMCLFLLTALCVGLVMETPFLCLTEFICPCRSLPKSLTFWMISIVVVVGITCLSVSALSSVSTQIGLQGVDTKHPFLDPDLGVVFIAVGSSIAWFGLRVYFRAADRRFKAALLVLSFLYLGAIGSTAYLRHKMVEQLDANFIVPPTAVIDG